MKKWFRLMSLFLVICLFLPTVAVSASQEQNNDYRYTVEDGEVTITGCLIKGLSVVIPAEIDGYPVTKIGKEAFHSAWAPSYQSIVLPDSVTEIGDVAFSLCFSLQSITFGAGLKTIGVRAFSNCDDLRSVTFPSSLQALGTGAFELCDNLSNVTFLGDAPHGLDPEQSSKFQIFLAFADCAKDMKITYRKEASGFTSPYWCGIPSAAIDANGAEIEAASTYVTPYPPNGVAWEDYLIFENSTAYESTYWELILELRESAAKKAFFYDDISSLADYYSDDAGMLFEILLACYQNLTCFPSRYVTVSYPLAGLTEILPYNSREKYLVYFWGAKGYAAMIPSKRIYEHINYYYRSMAQYDYFDKSKLLNDSSFDAYRQSEYNIMDDIIIRLDQMYLDTDTSPILIDDRTMVPIRAISEALGADVGWDDATQKVTLSRAGRLIELTLDRKTAIVDGMPIELDVAPTLYNDRTLLPLRFVSEQFGQVVEWEEANQRISIYEDTSVLGDSNLDSWVLAMGSILLHENGDDVYQLSGGYRSSNEVERCRNLLSGSWGSPNRESLLRQIKALLSYGHNSAFKHDYSIASALSQEDFDALLEQSNDLDRYMWRQVKQLGDKWGDTGIIAWDLMRVSHLVQWGYRSGYLTYAEAHALVEPAAKQLQQHFTSWDEAMENYLDGYAYWGRIDMTLADTKYQSRKAIYEQLKAEQAQNGILYDDALWDAPLIPVPNINAESLLEGF